MKSMVFAHPFRILATLFVGLLVQGSAINARAQATESAASPLEGTWLVQVSQYNCSTGVTRPPFASLLTFARGGIMTESTSNPALLPGQRTAGHGFWQVTGVNSYLAVTDAFILFDSPTNPPGLKKGIQKITQSIAFTDENHWAALATVKFFNADGTTSSGCAKAQATRITASPDQP